MIIISESFFFPFFLRIQSTFGDTFIIVSPSTDTLERLRLSRVNLFVLIVSTFGCCYFIFLSFELADNIDIFLGSSFSVSSVSVFEEDLDLSNEGN